MTYKKILAALAIALSLQVLPAAAATPFTYEGMPAPYLHLGSVLYHGSVYTLTIGDVLGGWTVVDISPDRIVFSRSGHASVVARIGSGDVVAARTGR